MGNQTNSKSKTPAQPRTTNKDHQTSVPSARPTDGDNSTLPSSKRSKKRKKRAHQAAEPLEQTTTSHLEQADLPLDSSCLPPTKRPRPNPASPISENPSKSQPTNTSTTINLNPLLSPLPDQKYTTLTQSILTSSQITKKVTACLNHLIYPAVKPNVVVLYAKANAAAKLISVVEIVKREIAGKKADGDGVGGGKWFQYTTVWGEMGERKKVVSDGKNGKGGGKGKGKDKVDTDVDAQYGSGGEEEGEEESFETMKTPFERAIEGTVKVRAIPYMAIYLSRVRIDGLRKALGETTNALPATD